MQKPIVAIVGRPNVGKSTLFNKLAGEKISIVDDTPGVTRDRIYVDVEWLKYKFTLIDTGGIEPKSDDIILKQMKRQAEIAIETADVIMFLVDAKQGLVDTDYEVATMLRKSKKPILVVVNKVDNRSRDLMETYEFYNLGLGDPIAISSSQSLGLGDMLDAVTSYFRPMEEVEYDEDVIKVAIVGKPNVGKSSLINRILGEERVIVSDIAGTTRDAIDTFVTVGEDKFVFIDTAGIRRKSKIYDQIEKYSIIRAVAAVERADIAVLVIDAEEGITDQDTKIIGIAHEKGKGIIIAVNKWDKLEKNDKTMNKYLEELNYHFAYMKYSLKMFISALTGQRVNKMYEMITTIHQNQCLRVGTGVLNEVLYEATAAVEPPSDRGKRLKIYYMTQVSIKPPTFVIFVNDKELMHYSYTRYIENKLRDTFGFIGTPIHFIIREKGEKK